MKPIDAQTYALAREIRHQELHRSESTFEYLESLYAELVRRNEASR